MSAAARSAFAVLTPPGRGGIAVIRCVGPAVSGAIEACFRKKVSGTFSAGPMATGTLAYGHIVDAQGRPLDEVILHREGEAFEVNCHGGPAAVWAVSERLAALGLEEVDADALLAAEGVPRLERDARRALRTASTPLAARILLDQLGGALARALEAVCGTGRLSTSECEGGMPPTEAIQVLDGLLDRWHTCGRFLADPPRIAITGRPNAGKSTLLNRLVAADRAITSGVPGTTRDAVEADASLDGVPVLLVDTAGLRRAGEGVEQQGIERARREIRRADLVVYLVDAAAGAVPEDDEMTASLGRRGLVVWNKADVAVVPDGVAAVSALRGDGIGPLVSAILERLGWHAPAPGEAVPFTVEQATVLETARQALAGGKTREALAAARDLLA